MKHYRLAALLAASAACTASSSIAEEDIDTTIAVSSGEVETSGTTVEEGKWLSIRALADIETAYICRGYVWDSRPYSAQSVDGEADFGAYGRLVASVWTMSALSGSGHSDDMGRYAYAEVDYVLRYSVDAQIAEGWRLQNTVSRQWVTNPGYRRSHTLADWQAMQILHNPYVIPYWRLRYIHDPRQSAYWCVGLRKTVEVVDGLDFTADFFGDLGDHRHYRALYGPKEDGGRYHAGLQALNLVLRLDYKLMDHVGIFAFVGQFCLVNRGARDAIKASDLKQAKRDLTYGGVGVTIDF